MRSDNEIRDAFGRIVASQELKASTRERLRAVRSREEGRREERRKRPGCFRNRLWKVSAAVCAALFLTLGVGSHVMLGVPVAYVSIDVNPSIELELNRLDRVITAKAYNEDGEKVLEGLSVKGAYYTDAIELLVESAAMHPYLTGNGDLTFTVASSDGQREGRLFQGVKKCSAYSRHGGRSFRTDVEFLEEAHESGFSLGKYAAYKILQQYDASVTATDCHGMTMGEIRSMIQEHEAHGDAGGHGNCSESSGNSNGNGNGGNGSESSGNSNGDGNGGNCSGNGGNSDGDGNSSGNGGNSDGNGRGHGHGYGHGKGEGGHF